MRPRWPRVECPENSPLTAEDYLHAIAFRAFVAGAANRSRILQLALHCASHGYETNLPPEEHCKEVLRANAQAELGAWEVVEKHLDHG